MRALRSLGFETLAWSLRRLHVPVPDDALVLEVGAGGNPYPRSNVLLDGYDETPERLEPNLVRDRPLVLGFAERLPFKDQSFDFVIASHILEHSPDPENFLRELMRVGKAGYIETPDAFFERINPYTYHRLEVTDHGDVIRIFKKASWRPDTEIVDLYEKKMKDAKFLRFTSTHPEPFYMRHYWRGKIEFEIQNPEVDASWPLPPEAYHHVVPTGLRAVLRNTVLNTMRKLFSQNRRNQTIDVFALLRCPTCGAGDVQKTASAVVCTKCRAEYELRDGVPRMYPIDQARTA
jgi:SAM-dependent methyltransferase/uncharacterized protein YbaR (Trm112 family)